MKGGLTSIPGQHELERAYQQLLHEGYNDFRLKELALYSQWVRFDARLGEIWVGYVFEHWKRIPPMLFHEALLTQPWPACAAVLLEFVARAVSPVSIEQKEAKAFRLWKQLVAQDFSKASGEQFFIGQRRIAGRAMFDDARFALAEYRRWGYLAREVLFNKQRLPEGQRTHSLDAETRREVLKALFESTSRIATDTYWNALGKVISLRQAERDLKNNPMLKALGNTKGRYYVLRAGVSMEYRPKIARPEGRGSRSR